MPFMSDSSRRSAMPSSFFSRDELADALQEQVALFTW